MTSNELEVIADAFAADAVEYKGRIFVAQDKLLAYLAGNEIRVVRFLLDGEPAKERKAQ